MSALVSRQYKTAGGTLATPGKTFGGTNIRGTVLSAELGVSFADAERAVTAIVDAARAHPSPAWWPHAS